MNKRLPYLYNFNASRIFYSFRLNYECFSSCRIVSVLGYLGKLCSRTVKLQFNACKKEASIFIVGLIN